MIAPADGRKKANLPPWVEKRLASVADLHAIRRP
jgi:hypothetical protein